MQSLCSNYVIKSLVHASQVLAVFGSKAEVLRLKDVVTRTGFNKAMCFRLLFTLRECNFLEKVGENQYRLVYDVRPTRKCRIGFAAQGQESFFAREVSAGILRAAENAHVELVVMDNKYDPRIALRNADQLIREGVDLIIEFQTDESAAPAIATKVQEAGIPMIAVDIPHPSASYFGANNYEAGLVGGGILAAGQIKIGMDWCMKLYCWKFGALFGAANTRTRNAGRDDRSSSPELSRQSCES